MPKIRVLVVDDAVVMRRLLTEALARDPDIEVVGVAAHGGIALARIPQLNPDVVTLDVEMPEMDGLATVRAIRKTWPHLPVIMFSTLTERGAVQTLDALAAGATDYVTKPANVGSIGLSLQRLDEELAPKIKLHARHLLPPAPVARAASPPATFRLAPSASVPPEIIALGTSTGGPNALATVFTALPAPLPVPVVIVQHMPVLFTRMLAERLDKLGGTRFHEGAEGDRVEPGHAYIAPGGHHMEVAPGPGGLRLRLHDQPPENSCRPAVDVLFRSVAAACGGRTLGIILTGMGQDGLNGCRHLRERGAAILAQDEKSSVVWGMPGAVAAAGLADRILPLAEFAQEIRRHTSRPAALPSPRAGALVS